MRLRLGSTAAAAGALCLVLALPAPASADAAADLKTDIDAFIHRLETNTHGFLKWQGAERMEIHADGAGAVAEIVNAKITLQEPDAKPPAQPVRIGLDHIGIRREPEATDASRLSLTLPAQATLLIPDQDEVKLTLDKAAATALLDAAGRARESSMTIAGARLSGKKSSDWVAFGPLSFTSKLSDAGNGGWTATGDFELKKIEFFFAEAPVGGAIDRIGYTASSAGPDLAGLNKLRDRFEAMRAKDDSTPKERLDALFDMLQSLPGLFSEAKGELTIDKVVARMPTGEPLVSLDKMSLAGGLTGLAGDAAALRITLRHDGLSLAPAIVQPTQVPRRAILDFGLENVATGPLRSIVEAASRMRADASDADKQRAQQQMLGAVAMLEPVLRVYDLAVETPDVGIDATAEATGSPLSPKGYAAQGNVAVRGFDALPALVDGAPLAAYLPLLKALATPADGANGGAKLNFHLTSAPPKWLTLNGSDITPWFAADSTGPGQPRLLRPAEPPLAGTDVRAVQRALAAAKIEAPQSGNYDDATAAAVLRFQNQNGLNADGVVDAATRQKLGVKPEPAPPAPGARKGAN